MKILEYKVIGRNNLKDLNAHVNEAIADGWQPLGQCEGDSSHEGTFYIQTVVNYGEGDPWQCGALDDHLARIAQLETEVQELSEALEANE